MSILDFLGLGANRSTPETTAGRPSAMEHIVERLKDMPTQEAEWIAAFAMVIARAARADFEVDSKEAATIESLLEEHGGLDANQASLVAEMVTKRNLMVGAGDDYLATREFRRIARDGGLEKTLRCLFAVSAADEGISLVEEKEIQQVARELGIEDGQLAAIRAEFHDEEESR